MLDFLHLHALWLIMDPWLPHPWPRDRKQWPDIDEHNQITVNAICDYLPRLSHAAISVDLRYNINPRLQHLPNTKNNLQCLIELMNEKSLQHIVYIGFHWGICMLNKLDGAVNVKQHTSYKLYTLSSLCAVMPGTEKRRLDNKMSAYVDIL